MSRSTIEIVVVMVIYLAFVVGIGVYFSRKNKDASDFYLGGRKLGPLVTAMSAEASDMSSYLLMGLPGLAYISGLADPAWTAIGLAVGTYLNWLIVSKKLRRYTEATESITVPQFFSDRFGDSSYMLCGVAALIIVIFFVPYTASGFSACGKLFGTLFDAPYMPTMIISAIVIVAYTALGGFLAASTSDFFQSICMTIALIIMLIFGVSVAGGLNAVLTNAGELPGYLSMTMTHDMATGAANPYGPLTIISTLAWGLGYFGMPHILLRFMGTESEEKLDLSRRVATTWVVISMAGAIFIGIVGYSISKIGQIEMLNSADSEKIIVKLAMLLSERNVLAGVIAGIVLAGILAATMSTSDSQLLAASSSVSQDLAQRLFGIRLSSRSEMLLARGTVLVIAVIAVFLARDPDSSVFGIVSFAWAGFGAAFGPLVLCALFWKRTNKWGALAGMIVGGAMVFIWKYLIAPLGGIFNIYELLPAFLLSLIAIVVVSLITPAPDRSVVEQFDAVSAKK